MSLPVTTLNPLEVRFQNAAALVAAKIAIPLGGEDRYLSLQPTRQPIDASEATFSLLVDGYHVVIEFSKTPISDATLLAMGVISFQNLPEEMQQLILERAINSNLTSLSNWSGRRVELGIDPSHVDLPLKLPFRLDGNDSIEGCLYAPSEAAPMLTSLLETLPKQKYQSETVPISLGIEIGRTQLDITTIRSLESGDVVIIESGPDLKNNQIELRPSHSKIYRGRLRGPDLKIESYMSIQSDQFQDLDNASEAAHAGLPAKRDTMTSVGDIPVDVVFELGRRQITVDDLDQLQPGTVLELEHSVEEAKIIIRANGKAIATGTLAEVNDKIAVRLD